MYLARAYGLGFASQIPLPELFPDCTRVDVRISLASLARPTGSEDPHKVFCKAGETETYIWWPGTGAFLIRGGNEILVDPLPDVEERVLRLHLLSFALTALLRQRGFLVLHGSALARGGRVITFLGASHSGKSTIAGMLLGREYQLLADDMVALTYPETKPQQAVVVPGFPQVK